MNKQLSTIILVLTGVVFSYGANVVAQETIVAGIADSLKVDTTFGPGDRIDIQFFSTPELNQSQIVRPDGKISLVFIGDMEVAGKTPQEVRSAVRALYSNQLNDPEITVIAREINSRKIFVAGEVTRPGSYPLRGNITPFEAIIEAGGTVRDRAALGNVKIIRNEAGQNVVYKQDINKIIKAKNGEQFYLLPSDIVLVPPKKINVVNQWIDTYISNVIPRFLWTAIPIFFTYRYLQDNDNNNNDGNGSVTTTGSNN